MKGASDIITRDLSAKCDEDVRAAIKRTAALADSKDAAAQIAFVGVGSALGYATAAMLARFDGQTKPPEPATIADELWKILRPMVLKAAEAGA